MEFQLKLSDALLDLKEQPDPQFLGMMASSLLIPKESQILRQLACPECGAKDWETAIRASLVPKSGLDWPYTSPGGDRLHCRCKQCDHSITVTFWFTR